MDYNIPLVWLSRCNKGEYLEGPDSSDAEEDSSDEEFSASVFEFCADFTLGEQLFNFLGLGLRVGMERFHPVHAL